MRDKIEWRSIVDDYQPERPIGPLEPAPNQDIIARKSILIKVRTSHIGLEPTSRQRKFQNIGIPHNACGRDIDTRSCCSAYAKGRE